MNTTTISQLIENPEKGLAKGVLQQAAADLRRFHNATSKVERELYRDAYSWLITDDFSWPYSFVNVCALLNLCPDHTRAELLQDISLGALRYWNKVVQGLFGTIKAGLTQRFYASAATASPAAEFPTVSYIYQ